MLENDDWRLQGQENYLQGVALSYKKWSVREGNDHDHCEFCGEKFMSEKHPNTLHEGYTTLDDYHWICNSCFEDFKQTFSWKVVV